MAEYYQSNDSIEGNKTKICTRYLVCELPTPKGMSFGDTYISSLFLLLPAIAF